MSDLVQVPWLAIRPVGNVTHSVQLQLEKSRPPDSLLDVPCSGFPTSVIGGDSPSTPGGSWASSQPPSLSPSQSCPASLSRNVPWTRPSGTTSRLPGLPRGPTRQLQRTPRAPDQTGQPEQRPREARGGPGPEARSGGGLGGHVADPRRAGLGAPGPKLCPCPSP